MELQFSEFCMVVIPITLFSFLDLDSLSSLCKSLLHIQWILYIVYVKRLHTVLNWQVFVMKNN